MDVSKMEPKGSAGEDKQDLEGIQQLPATPEAHTSDLILRLGGEDVQWKSKLPRNPITGEGVESEEYSSAIRRKQYRNC